MKKVGVIGAALLLSLGIIACNGGTGRVRMATGGTTGVYYAYGSAVGQILNEKTKIPIMILSTGGSRANIQLIEAGEVEMAIVQNDIMDYAYRGEDLFNGQKFTGFSAMAALYAETCQIVANPASGIRTIADLKGKNVSVGDAGSGTEFNARQILEAYGISFSEIGKYNLDFLNSAEAFKDNRIDAFFCVAGSPTLAISELAINRNIAILEIDDIHADRLIRNYPFYTKFYLPAGTYNGQSGMVQTVAVKAAFIVSSSLSEDTVYRLTKSLFENKALIEAAHEKGGELSASWAVEGISVPFHSGAAKYFREAGVLR